MSHFSILSFKLAIVAHSKWTTRYKSSFLLKFNDFWFKKVKILTVCLTQHLTSKHCRFCRWTHLNVLYMKMVWIFKDRRTSAVLINFFFNIHTHELKIAYFCIDLEPTTNYCIQFKKGKHILGILFSRKIVQKLSV